MTRLIGSLLLLIVAGGVFMIAIAWLFAPWSFYMGGSFHVLPVWQGAARVHTTSGEYTLYLWLSPSRGGRTFNLPTFRGSGSLCTPRGERYQLRVWAELPERTGTDTNGKEMQITLYRRPWYWSLAGVWDRRPEIALRGRWQNPDFVANDGGTFSRTFLPDGRLYDGPAKNQPHARETVPVVLHEVSWATWYSDCRAVK